MILSGAYFDNNMPKWATEETMKRIGNDLKKDNSQSRKQHDKIILLLGKIVQNSTKEEKNQRETLKEIKSIAKEIKDSNKTNKELVKELKKSNKLAEDANKQAKKDNTSGAGKVQEVDTSEMEGHLLDVNKRLEDIYKIMKQSSTEMSRSMEERNKMIGRSSLKPPSVQESNVSRQKEYSADNILSQTLEELSDKNDRRGRRGMGIANEISSSKNPMKRFNGRVMAMISALGSFVKRIKQLGGMIFDLIKKIPFIGAKVAAVATAMGTALDFANIINEHYTEYKTAIDAGLYLARRNVEQTRMDGIMVRKMIGEVGLTVLAGIESMHQNISAVNELGLEEYFGTIGQVMGDAQNKEAFINRVMMNQGQIAKFTGEFLKTLKSVSDFERLNSIERTKSVQTFIKNTRMFSQLTGKSMEHLSKLMLETQRDPRVTTTLAGIRDEETRSNARQIVANVVAAVGDTNNPIYKAFATSLTDVTGAGVAANRELYDSMIRVSSVLYGDDRLIKGIDEIAELARRGELDTANAKIVEYIQQIQKAYDNLSESQSEGLIIYDDGAISNLLSGILSANANMLNNTLESGRIVENQGYVGEQSTELAEAAQRARATQQQAEAALEYAMANVAGSEMSRDAMMMGYDVMIKTNDLTEKGARAAVISAHALMENLPSIGRDVYDILRILDDDRKSRKEKAENALDTLDLGAQAKMQRDALSEALKESGFAITDGKEGGRRSEMAARYRASRDNQQKFDELGLSIEELSKQAMSPNRQTASVARDMLMYMGSEQMRGVFTKRDRNKYKEALDEVLNKLPEEQREAYYSQMEQKLRTGTAALTFRSMVDQSRAKLNSPNMESQTPKADEEKIKSESSQAVESANREIEESTRQYEEAQGRIRRRTQENVVMNENGIPNTIARPDSNVDNQQNGVNLFNILNDNLSIMNSKLDDLIGVTKLTGEESHNTLRDIRQNTSQNRGSLSS